MVGGAAPADAEAAHACRLREHMRSTRTVAGSWFLSIGVVEFLDDVGHRGRSRARTTQRTPGSARVVGRLDSGRPDAVEICRLFNEPGARCSYPACRYAHLCTRCHQPHPQFECGKPKRGRSRSPPPPRGDRKPRR